MPCYEVNLISVEFNIKNRDWLEAALEELGLQYWKRSNKTNTDIIEEFAFRVNLKTGTVEMDRNPKTAKLVNKLKQEYTKQAVIEATRRHKWALRVNSKNPMKMEMRRY